jgi:SAM-dependent methyltransferase
MSNALALSIGTWSSGIAHEVDFWSKFLKTNGLLWPAEYVRRLDPDAELDPTIGAILERAGDGATILDVGAGPLTVLGKKWKQSQFSIRAVDPLAELYDRLLATCGATPIVPVVRTEFALVEDLSAFFDPASFDMVHCRNALDHSFDPLQGVIEMLRIVKVGGTVMLRHNRNEAETENYGGFHQFNLDVRDGIFVIWNRSVHMVVADCLPVEADIGTEFQDGQAVVYLRKQSEFADASNPERFRNRVKSVLTGTLSYFIGLEMAKLA